MKGKIKILLAAMMMTTTAMIMSLSAVAESKAEEITVGDWRAEVHVDTKKASIIEYVGKDTEVTVPSTLLGEYKVVEIKSITLVEYMYHHYSDITKITIPASVEKIQGAAFREAPKMTAYVVASGNPYYTAVNGILYSKDKKEIVAYPQNKGETSFSIPSGTVTIEDYCFACNPVLSSVTIPSTVKTIGEAAFCGCENLSRCSIPSSVTSIGERAFQATVCTEFTVPASVTDMGWGYFTIASLFGR